MPPELTEDQINKLLEERIELLEKTKALTDEQLASLSATEAAEARQALAFVENLAVRKEAYDLTIKELKQQKDKVKNNDELKDSIQRNIDQVKIFAKVSGEKQKEITDALEETAGVSQKLGVAISEAARKGEKELERVSSAAPKQMETNWTDAIDILVGGTKGAGRIMMATFSNPALWAAGTMGFKDMQLGVSGLLGAIKTMPSEVDKNFHQVMKETGLTSKIIYDSMTQMMDPLYAEREHGLFRGMISDAKPLANIGMSAKETGAAMGALIKDASLFRPAFIQNNKEASVFVGNLMGGLQKIGVPLATSAKNLDKFTKAMQLTPMQAAKSVKSLVTISDSLGVEAGKVAANFEQVGPDIVMFGDRSIEVFAKLQAQATATGLEMGKLVGWAKEMDTFEGAAQQAQMMNAVLGDTFISVTDLVHADFPDKISMIQDAMANAGIDFETADRRMKQVITNAMGLKDVEEAARFLTNKDEAEEFADSVDTTAATQDDLKARILDGMTATEKMTRTLSSLAGGVTEFNQRIHVAADDISGALAGTFAEVAKSTGDSEAAMASLIIGLGQIKGLTAAAQTGMSAWAGSIGVAGAGMKKLVDLLKASPKGQVAIGLAGAGGLATMGVGAHAEYTAGPPTTTPAVAPAGASMDDVLKAVNNLSDSIKNQNIQLEIPVTLDGREVGKSVAPTVIELHQETAEREHQEIVGGGF